MSSTPPEFGTSIHADASVRLAQIADAVQIARVQVECWRTWWGESLGPAFLEALDPSDIAQQWAYSIRVPPPGAHRVLIAESAASVVGFAASAPASDPDHDSAEPIGELVELLVLPTALGKGHGSRLLMAIADLAREDGITELVTWIGTADPAKIAFLESAGWGRDGAERELDVDAVRKLTQVRLVTLLG